jgi:hypothetical protein
MAIYGDFSSLLQLGVGLGIALSLFRAPVDLRTARIARALDGDILALRGVPTEFARTKRIDLMNLRLHFQETCEGIEKSQLPFMIAALVAALINLGFLIKASFDAGGSVGPHIEYVMTFFSVAIYFLIGLGLEVLARYQLGPILQKLNELRERKAQ